MNIYENQWKYIKNNENQCKSMDVYKNRIEINKNRCKIHDGGPLTSR